MSIGDVYNVYRPKQRVLPQNLRRYGLAGSGTLGHNFYPNWEREDRTIKDDGFKKRTGGLPQIETKQPGMLDMIAPAIGAAAPYLAAKAALNDPGGNALKGTMNYVSDAGDYAVNLGTNLGKTASNVGDSIMQIPDNLSNMAGKVGDYFAPSQTVQAPSDMVDNIPPLSAVNADQGLGFTIEPSSLGVDSAGAPTYSLTDPAKPFSLSPNFADTMSSQMLNAQTDIPMQSSVSPNLPPPVVAPMKPIWSEGFDAASNWGGTWSAGPMAAGISGVMDLWQNGTDRLGEESFWTDNIGTGIGAGIGAFLGGPFAPVTSMIGAQFGKIIGNGIDAVGDGIGGVFEGIGDIFGIKKFW